MAYLENFAAQHGLDGGAVAYAASAEQPPTVWAFGYADAAAKRAMRPDDRFKIASLSKPITSAGIFALVRRGEIGLDTPLGELFPSAAAAADTRIGTITVRQLLTHSGGWDRSKTFDPILLTATRLAWMTGRALPADPGCEAISEAMLALPLQTDPGTAFAYANLGYCWLSRIVARGTDKTYEARVKELVPGIVGLSRNAADVTVVPRGIDRSRPLLIGSLEAVRGAGDWVGNVRDYFEFATHPISEAVFERPQFAEGPQFYGLGWRVWEFPRGRVVTHAGSMPGVVTVVIRKLDGPLLVVFFNGAPRDSIRAFEEILGELERRYRWDG